MTVFDYDLNEPQGPNVGLIVLQTDERIEKDFRSLFPASVNLFVSRVPSSLDVTPDTLQKMEAHIPTAAGLLPETLTFDAVGYGCTSGSAQIGQSRVGDLLRSGAKTRAVSDPVSALLAACSALGLGRLAFLSPYVAEVSDNLRQTLRDTGVETPVFGSFAEAEEVKVVRISPGSIQSAALELVDNGDVDGVFLSCTNLNTLDVIEPLEQLTGRPVLSSNQVLAWHLLRLAQSDAVSGIPGKLGAVHLDH